MAQAKTEEEILHENEKIPEAPKPHIPEIAKKVSRFGPQNASKYGKGASSSPQLKQRPGRAAARGR